MQGYFTFPGIQQIIRGTYTLSHGIAPGVATIEMVPQVDLIAQGGTLGIHFGSVNILFPGCRIDQSSLRHNPSAGYTVSVRIFDRRWRWAFGSISGVYNRLDDAEVMIEDSERSPQQLAAMLLTAMGETSFDVSQLPNDTRPHVEWIDENPARALADLCDSLGCRIVLGIDNIVRLCRVGVGAMLPINEFVLSENYAVDPPERPDSLLVVGSPTRYQLDFYLEAVGEDVDGSIVPIDELSYMPDGGWSKASLFTMANVAGQARALARKTVYRWYRIHSLAHESDQIPGMPEILDVRQCLPIEDVQVAAGTANGRSQSLPAMIWGSYRKSYAAKENWPDATPNPGESRYTRPFTIDRERGIVQFGELMIRWTAPTEPAEPADLVIRCACPVRDHATWASARYEKTLSYGAQWGTGPRVLRRPELVRTVMPIWEADDWTARSIETNDVSLDQEAIYYLQAADLEYQVSQPQDLTYAGFLPINPDGAIQQVGWTFGPAGGRSPATTRASRNAEYSAIVPSYKERRQQDLLRAMRDNARL